MNMLWQGIRIGLRMLAKNPGTTAVMLLTLALGIGANTAIFSVVNAVVLKPLPYPAPDRLVIVHNIRHGKSDGPYSSSQPDFEDWQKQNRVFEHMGLFTYWAFNLTGREVPEHVVGSRVTGDFFSTLGAKPLLGRTLTPDDDRPDTAEAVVLSHRLWQRSFGADAGVIGKVATLEGRPHYVVGVMPPEFRFPEEEVELWGAIKNNMGTLTRQNRFLFTVARLREGVSIAKAQANLDSITAPIAAEHKDTNEGHSTKLISAQETLVGDARPALLALLGAVGFLLLIACANTANLLLAQASARQREFAIRTALGASRGQLLFQTLIENLLMAAAAGGLGIATGVGGMHVLRAMHPGGVPRLDETALDTNVLTFTLGVSLLMGLLLSLLPVLPSWKTNFYAALKEGGRSETGRAGYLRPVLVAAEVAFSLVLLTGGGLLLRSFAKLMAVDPGYQTQRVLIGNVFLTGPRYRGIQTYRRYVKQALESVAALPGVESAAASTEPPLGDGGTSFTFFEDGSPLTAAQAPLADYRAITEKYFDTLKIPFLKGRNFASTDQEGAPLAIIVNETLARKTWPNQDAIGKRIRWTQQSERPEAMTVVGVVRDVKQRGLDRPEGMVIYAPLMQLPWTFLRGYTFVVKTAANPLSEVISVQKAILQADPDMPVFRIATLENVIHKSVGERRFNLFLLQLFAAVALALAAVGIYGVVSYSVGQRTREFGVRLALGAPRRHIFGLVLGPGMMWTGFGVAAGLAGALVAARFIQTMLFGIEPTDPLTFSVVALLLASVAAAACIIPARRAVRVDPMKALRYE